MRGKKAAVNTAFSLIEEVIAIICGFILPRLILSAFGSTYNGLTTSITQFLSCAVLLRSGIGGATRAALYKPLAEKNQDDLNSIVRATDIFMKKIGLLLAGLIVAFSVVYPFFVLDEFEWFFTFSLFLIIGLSTFAESFFGITYLIVLQADQRLWISALMKSICYIINIVIATLLIYGGASIHMVKLGSAIIYVAYPIVLGLYVRKHYHIKRNVKSNNEAISQRWDAFWQQVAIFVMNNTDVIILTIFTNMLTVSVYSVYNLVVNGLRKGLYTFLNGIEAAFGNMIAKGETELLKHNLAVMETIIYGMSTVVFSCAAALIIDFIRIYTAGIHDVDYIQPSFAFVIIVASFFNCVRLPYQLVVQAAGHYKQTKNGAIIEPIINIVVSVVFVFNFGLIGVAVGTLAATVFRTIQYSTYVSKNIVKRSYSVTFIRCLTSLLVGVTVFFAVQLMNLPIADGYLTWIFHAFIVLALSIVLTLLANFVFFRKELVLTAKKIKGLFTRKKRQKPQIQ